MTLKPLIAYFKKETRKQSKLKISLRLKSCHYENGLTFIICGEINIDYFVITKE